MAALGEDGENHRQPQLWPVALPLYWVDTQMWKLRAVGDLQANQTSPYFTARELRPG